MSTDIERELRELFRDKTGEAPVATPAAAAGAPQEVLRRGRLHQVGTVVGSAVVVFALVFGSVAGLGSLLRGRDTAGGGEYEVFERTATIEAFTVTSPSDWYLVNHWPQSLSTAARSGTSCEDNFESTASGLCVANPLDPIHTPPSGVPMLQLSNIDLGLDHVACRDGLPSDAAVLYVGYIQSGIEPIAPDLNPFPPGPGEPERTQGPCGPGSYVEFTVNRHAMFAWIGIGSGVSDADRGIVATSYEEMSAVPGWELAPPAEATPAYVLAGGTSEDAEPWRLELRPSERNVEVTLMGGVPLGAMPGVSVPTDPIDWCCEEQPADPIFGAIAKDATGVEFRPGNGSSPVPGTILPVPPSVGSFDFDLFFIERPEGHAAVGGDVIALGLEGGPGPQVTDARAATTELGGSFEGQAWTARFTGSFADGTACVFVTVDEPYEPFCAELPSTSFSGEWPYFNGTITPDLYLLTGSVPPAVDEIRFASDDDAIVPTQVRCAMGPAGWTDPDREVCAMALPTSGSGTLRYLDADGNLLFEEGIGWGIAQPRSNEYPWTNEDGVITARGSFQGAEWALEVLHYLDGYRLTVDGRVAFEGPLGLGEARSVGLFSGERAGEDALVLALTTAGPSQTSVSIVTPERTWEGRWIPGSLVTGDQAKLWILEMQGSGTGTYRFNGDALQGEISWP